MLLCLRKCIYPEMSSRWTRGEFLVVRQDPEFLNTLSTISSHFLCLPPNKQLFRQSLYHSLLHRYFTCNPYKVKSVFFFLDQQRWISSFMWARNWIVEQEFSLDEFDRILEPFFSCSMQSLTITLKTFRCSPVAVNSFFFFFIFPKCFYGLRLCSPTFFECQLPIAISWHLLWVSLLEGKPYALGRMATWSLLSGRAAYGLSWRLDFYVPVSLCKLLLFQSFFCLYSVDNSTFINHWQDSHPDAKHLREKD